MYATHLRQLYKSLPRHPTFFSSADALNGKAGLSRRAQTFLQAMQGFFGGVARGSDTLRPCRGFPASQKTSPFFAAQVDSRDKSRVVSGPAVV
jgi:hypothetical protein